MAKQRGKDPTSYNGLALGADRSRPILHRHAREIQPFGKIAKLPIALDAKVCQGSVTNLNQLLADTMRLAMTGRTICWSARFCGPMNSKPGSPTRHKATGRSYPDQFRCTS